MEGLHTVSCKYTENTSGSMLGYLLNGGEQGESQTQKQKWFHSKQEFSEGQ